MNSLRDHLRVIELESHRVEVNEIKRNASHWRLTDCSVDTLERMRRALLEEMERLEKQLAAEDQQFLFYIEQARPLETEASRETIDRLSADWEELHTHLRNIDNTILEHHLRARLTRLLGGNTGYYVLEAAVFISILLAIVLTIFELAVPLPTATINTLLTIDTIISLFLLSDFFLRLFLSEDRRWYIGRYWIDFISSIPLSVLHFGRLVRITRFARLLRLLRLPRLTRALGALLYAFRGVDKLGKTFQVNLLKRSLIIATALLAFGAITITALEGPREQSLQSLNESFWWSFTTVVTGGFADLYNPATTTGRLLTVGLVLLGLVVTGIFTASLTSVLVGDDSARITQNQYTLETEMGVLNQKLDLLSGETNRGLIALEEVAQQLANQTTHAALAKALSRAMLDHFQCLQASVYLLDSDQKQLRRHGRLGDERADLPETIALGNGLAGRTTALLLKENNPAALDIEPVTEPCFEVSGVRMICPMVANQQVVGALHVVLPEEYGRFYLYNRAPQTLAHHAASAFLLLDREADVTYK